jgi:hypothetical protein
MYPNNMKKFICIFLAVWLPLFISAAGATSLQMTLANVDAQSQATTIEIPPCHQHMASSSEKTQQNDETPSKQHHLCAVCGFCVVTSGFASLTHAFNLQTVTLTSPQPLSFVAVFHSQTYPPAIKPPISH